MIAEIGLHSRARQTAERPFPQEARRHVGRIGGQLDELGVVLLAHAVVGAQILFQRRSLVGAELSQFVGFEIEEGIRDIQGVGTIVAVQGPHQEAAGSHVPGLVHGHDLRMIAVGLHADREGEKADVAAILLPVAGEEQLAETHARLLHFFRHGIDDERGTAAMDGRRRGLHRDTGRTGIQHELFAQRGGIALAEPGEGTVPRAHFQLEGPFGQAGVFKAEAHLAAGLQHGEGLLLHHHGLRTTLHCHGHGLNTGSVLHGDFKGLCYAHAFGLRSKGHRRPAEVAHEEPCACGRYGDDDEHDEDGNAGSALPGRTEGGLSLEHGLSLLGHGPGNTRKGRRERTEDRTRLSAEQTADSCSRILSRQVKKGQATF